MGKSYVSEIMKCVVCGAPGVDLHHIKTRGAGGGDEEFNLMPLCHKSHVEVHNIGLLSFSKKYPEVKRWLVRNGWELLMSKKWVHSASISA